METIKLRDEYIKLGQALKAAGFVESGVDAKYAIEDGLVYVNGEQAFQRGKKLVDGDVVTYEARPSKLLNKSLKENFYDHRIHRT
ncbi:RNA-binding S4 domain-containing protein [Clostridium sp. AM51-4]|nr:MULTISPECIES: RNA-binding S4 domain-containing protein [unclassified Clostridium]RHQ01598.1 RNA-binding S4 domain-containing protein [Clostridium sp. AM51-4]RHV47796.1 RNA-binding S4 domain-containing protein [Clostridium sp. OM04-12AA]